MNKYFIDAGIFLRSASNKITKDINDDDAVQIALNIALGIERILKGILYDINPTYIYIEPKFDNTIQILYPDQLVLKQSENLSKNPNKDVITFKISLLRAECVSFTTNKNRNLLFKIENIRDVLAHCDLAFLDIKDITLLIKRDFYPLLKSYCEELKLPSRHIFDNKHIRLATISSSLTSDLSLRINMLFEAHKEKWKMLSGNPGYITDKIHETKLALDTPNKYPIKCPCCGNTGVFYLDPIKEFNQQTKEENIVGAKLKLFRCRFCKLLVEDEKLFDELGFNKIVSAIILIDDASPHNAVKGPSKIN
jgi:hypothetical protein